jgi:hypothetical protein
MTIIVIIVIGSRLTQLFLERLPASFGVDPDTIGEGAAGVDGDAEGLGAAGMVAIRRIRVTFVAMRYAFLVEAYTTDRPVYACR